MKKVIIIILSLLFYSLGFSQNVEFSKSNFSNDKEGLKKASKNIMEGNEFYYAGVKSKALNYYLQAQKFNPTNGEFNAKIGVKLFNIPA